MRTWGHSCSPSPLAFSHLGVTQADLFPVVTNLNTATGAPVDIADPQVSSVWRVFPRIADFFRAKRGKLAGLPTQPGLGHWKVQDPRSALVGLLHPMSSMGLLTRFQFPENIYVIFFFPKDFPQVNKAYVLDNNE